MLNYVRQFIKIRVVFQTLYIWNEDGDPQFFFAFLAQVTQNLTAVKNLKNLSCGKFRENVLNKSNVDDTENGILSFDILLPFTSRGKHSVRQIPETWLGPISEVSTMAKNLVLP